MTAGLTCEKILEPFAGSSGKLEIGLEKSREEFNNELKRSRHEFDRKIGEISGTLGKFVEGLVEPKLLELFR